ncbi:MAG: hypothetical protein ABI687_04935 [Flavitalea sp.]
MMSVFMKYGCKHIAILLALSLLSSFLYAQVNITASIDRSRILIGEPILLSVEASVPAGETMEWFTADSIAHFEFIEKYKADTAEGLDSKKVTQLLSITSFDSGRWEIPSFQILVGGKPYYTDSISVDVSFVSFDPSADYRDIKEIEEVANTSVKYIPWILAALTLSSLALIIFLARKQKPLKTELKIATPLLTPYEEAIQALNDLRKKGTPVEGEEKLYYSKLNDILRVFVLRKYGIATLERTNEELIMQLSKMKLPTEPYTLLAQSLRMSDFVKFAKYRPSEQENKSNMDVIRSSIEILDNNTMTSAV